jgi:S-adenosylmethionine-diacylglycerol 3-amino-3-carboxypropyl transferase
MVMEQVPLYKLVFTHNWEDPESDHAALRIKPGDTVMAITSGGCNILGFLLFDPGRIYCVDINPTQSYLLELKIAAIRELPYAEFISFTGLTHHENRLALYDRIKHNLSEKALSFWNSQQQLLKEGIFMNGKYERFIRTAGKFIRLLQGKKRVLRLFDKKTKEEQQKYFDRKWNTRRFRYLLKILFNKRVLARRGLVADYFHFDDGSKSFAESFYNRSRKAFRDISIEGNYFVSLYLLGKYADMNGVPAYLKEEHYDIIRSRLGRINIITSEAQHWIEKMPDDSIDCFALSNICELMSENETSHLFEQVYRTGKRDARIIFRNLMVPRDVPSYMSSLIVKDHELSHHIFMNDRSFVYGKVTAYNVRK